MYKNAKSKTWLSQLAWRKNKGKEVGKGPITDSGMKSTNVGQVIVRKKKK